MFRKHLLAVTIAATAINTLHAADFSNAIFFGDSLSDAGTYAGEPPLAGVFPIAGKFTTNPGAVWSEELAAQLGHATGPANQGGTIYAAGGARVTEQPGYPNNPLVPFVQAAPPVSAQITDYLSANGGRADSNALYSVWAGANDFFALNDGDAAYNALPMTQVADNLAAQVARLKQAGARYIIVPNVGDIGATPAFAADGAAAQAAATQQVQIFNSALYTQLAARNIAVIPIDTYGLLAQVYADAGRFGITNVSDQACASVPSSLVCTAANYPAGADQSYIFADGVHPTSGIHKILADYVFSVLNAPQQIGMLADSSIVARSALHDLLRAQLIGGEMTRSQTGRNLWVSAQGSQVDRERVHSDPGASEEGYHFAIGTDLRIDTQWVVGAALNINDSDADYDDNRGDYSQRDIALSAYGGWQQEAWFARGALVYGDIDYAVDRRVPLGRGSYTADGDTDGHNFSAQLESGYEFEFDRFSTGPVLGLLAQHLRIDNFEESGAGAVNLGYGSQERHSLVGSAGWQFAYRLQQLQPYARIAVDYDFEDNEHGVVVSALSIPEALPFTMPVEGPGQTRYTAQLGLNGMLLNSIGFNIGAIQHLAQDDLRDLQLFGGISFAY